MPGILDIFIRDLDFVVKSSHIPSLMSNTVSPFPAVLVAERPPFGLLMVWRIDYNKNRKLH
jgi:hypothetical protein